MRGIGSGFIISPDGYILTNTHVVNNASKITVKLTDRREFDGKVIGMDERTDVAVIKINAKGDLPVVKLGDSNKLRPGQWVLAIGSPFGFENSVTAGVVSALARGNVGEAGNGYVPFIQTDVAVNPGNSGGPLFNLNGEVVGINSQIYSRSGGYEGISFSIPIDVANNVAEQLIKAGHVSRGRIGVTIQGGHGGHRREFRARPPARCGGGVGGIRRTGGQGRHRAAGHHSERSTARRWKPPISYRR